jgi:hypothetical protein
MRCSNQLGSSLINKYNVSWKLSSQFFFKEKKVLQLLRPEIFVAESSCLDFKSWSSTTLSFIPVGKKAIRRTTIGLKSLGGSV